MDELELLLALESQDLELFNEVSVIQSERDLILQKLDQDEDKLRLLTEEGTVDSHSKILMYFAELFE